jgi:ATP-dependent Lon protease
VLPIGGVKEKVLGAARAGIKEIILPAENAADLEDIPDEVQEELVFHLVEDLTDAIAIALRPEEDGARKTPSGKRGARRGQDEVQEEVASR